MAQSDKTFRYEPLKTTTSIRLIKLLPDLVDDQVAIVLSQFDIADIPNYHALSYHWGDPTPIRAVNVNGHVLYLHENLWQFLWRMWKNQASSYYWTDFLCLDQHNGAEITDQVARMGEIYSQAEEVAIWLGHDQLGEDAMKLILNWPGEVQITKDAMELDQNWPASIHFVEEKINRDGIMRAVLYILQRPYWERVWIIQEFVLAKKLCVLYGTASSKLEEFKSGVDPFRHGRVDFRLRQSIWTLCGLRGNVGKKQLWELLIDFENCVSTKKSDKIYGILGLVASVQVEKGLPSLNSLQVDYQKSVPTLFWDSVFCSNAPWEKYYDLLLSMGRMFYEGGIDMWDFRHLERYATSQTTKNEYRYAANEALATSTR